MAALGDFSEEEVQVVPVTIFLLPWAEGKDSESYEKVARNFPNFSGDMIVLG